MDTSKIDSIRAWPQPTNLKQLRGFLGLSGYYRRFVKGYAQLATPLTDLLKKNAFSSYPVFHISLLKKFVGSPSKQYLPLPLTTTEFGPSVQPFSILDFRIIMRHSKSIPQVLIQWDSLGPSSATWEDVKEIRESFPHFNLEDKVAFDGGSILTCAENVEERDKEGQVVMQKSHVASHLQAKGLRKSVRQRRENALWKDFVQ
uniref:Uncharacterized protein n=1 Tax=Cajanus cajan TaxID=3821 RepID=A0A151RGF3_CAJCA|nr:hypothetical protein KK1_037100 [Cajanus cajan]